MPSFTVEFPFLPITANQAFATDFRSKRRFKSKDYNDFQRKVFAQLKRHSFPPFKPTDHLSVEIEIHRDWYTQKGLIRKADVANLEKTLIDTVFGQLEIEDSQIFKMILIKKQSAFDVATVLKVFSLTES